MARQQQKILSFANFKWNDLGTWTALWVGALIGLAIYYLWEYLSKTWRIHRQRQSLASISEDQIRSEIEYNPKLAYIYWTGGYDSTFRICQALLDQKLVVQPVYIIDFLDDQRADGVQRRNRAQELLAMQRVRSGLEQKNPEASRRLLPTIYGRVPEASGVTQRFLNLDLFNRKINQYEGLTRFAYVNKVPIDLGITNLVRGHRNKFKEHIYQRMVKCAGGNFCLDEKDPDDPFYFLRYPLADLSKEEMLEKARKGGYSDLLELTWSCWAPVNGKACGRCQMCQERIINHPSGNNDGQKRRAFLSDTYCQPALEKYFGALQTGADQWEVTDQANGADFHHDLERTCSNCQITWGFSSDGVKKIGNKKHLAQAIKGQDFAIPTYAFSRDNSGQVESLKALFSGSGSGNGNVWIMKPEYGLDQRGIAIVTNYEELLQALQKNHRYRDWVVQQYLTNPLLFQGRKFHLRVYVLLYRGSGNGSNGSNGSNGGLQAYMYPKGYMYICDSPFVTDQYHRRDIHISKSCNNREFPGEFDAYYGAGRFEREIKPQLARMIAGTLRHAAADLTCPNQGQTDHQCYKILAYDVLPDESMKLHLMEINARLVGMPSEAYPGKCINPNPSLITPKFKEDMIQHLLNLVLKDQNTGFDLVFSQS